MTRSLTCATITLLLLGAGWAAVPIGGQGAQPTRAAVDVSKLGPQVGQAVPDFTLPDQTGRLRNLQSLAGPRGTMLVFLRSADW